MCQGTRITVGTTHVLSQEITIPAKSVNDTLWALNSINNVVATLGHSNNHKRPWTSMKPEAPELNGFMVLESGSGLGLDPTNWFRVWRFWGCRVLSNWVL